MVSLHQPVEESAREELREYDDVIAGLLARRGIVTAEEAERFLKPSYDEHVSHPFSILNLEKGARRLFSAIESGEHICIWSDYDCDGIPGGVILHDFLKKTGARFENYIPHRHHEGYGLNREGIKELADKGVKLLVTVDSGIVDNECVAYAGELGMDVIVTDHHLPQGELPSAFTVIDPKQEGETSEFREFCGAGLAWKLACGVLEVARGTEGHGLWDISEGWEKWLLDMVALATIADMVPLVGENRVLAKYGLIVMRKSKRIGLQKLCKTARVDQRYITEDDVGFMLAPRVNAASRLGDPKDAFKLFTTEDEAEADALAKHLEKINRSRKALAGSITKSVHEKLSHRQGELPEVIALGDPDWRPGLLGLVASGIAEEYGRPVFLWGREGTGELKGSCRGGPEELHVVELMTLAKDSFLEFGGHAGAGGFSLTVEQSFTLEEKLSEASRNLPRTEREGVFADAQLHLRETTHALMGRIDTLAPYGMENKKPAFLFKDVRVKRVSWFGKSGEHVRLTISHEDEEVTREAITFYGKRTLGKACELVEEGRTLSVVGFLEKDMFTRGQPIRVRLLSVHP